MSKFLEGIKVHKSWSEFFGREDVKLELEKIEKTIGDNFTPKANNVLRFANKDLMLLWAIWVGKDPYPQIDETTGELVATGRSFEVSGVDSWFDKRVNSSLKNIVKLINKTALNKNIGSGIDEIRKEIEEGKFKIPSPDKAFDYWESQGVLFLNSAFTCKVGGFEEAGSHIKEWKKFFDMLLEYISTKNPNIKYFLWGKSRDFSKKLKKYNVKESDLYLAYHPCTNGDNGGYKNNSKFLNCPCFEETKDKIDWVYKE